MSVLRAIWGAPWGLVEDWEALEVAFPRKRAGRLAARDRRLRSTTGTASPGWSPSDPLRRRIAGEYRRVAAAVRQRMGPLPGAETPSELARRIEAAETSDPALGVLTGIYELARFSEHQLDESVDRGRRRPQWTSRVAGKSRARANFGADGELSGRVRA